LLQANYPQASALGYLVWAVSIAELPPMEEVKWERVWEELEEPTGVLSLMVVARVVVVVVVVVVVARV
jgi:hypothetical protein